MHEGEERLYFCCAEEDSLYAVDALRRENSGNSLSGWEQRQLIYLEKRVSESRIYLTPAVVYAAANQKSFQNWFSKCEETRQTEWYQSGIVWMRRHPAFLEKFGWKERRGAIVAAGILAQAERTDAPEAWNQVCRMLAGSWNLLWERMKHITCLDAQTWSGMIAPWQDSACMASGMSGILLLMAALLGKPVRERDQLWRGLQKLKGFTEYCLESSAAGCESQNNLHTQERMGWLMERFKNPQRPTYIREKTRIRSEWLDQLYRIMDLAGLPVSACETMSLSCREVQQILESTDERITERQYMTFLMLYTVSRELAQAGRAAAALDIQGKNAAKADLRGKRIDCS